MMRSRSLALVLASGLAGVAAAGDPPLPPVPGGAPLEMPVEAVRKKATWVEDNEVRPASAVLDEKQELYLESKAWHPEAPPAAFAGSACNFDVPNNGDVFSPDYGNVSILFGSYRSITLGPSIPAFNYIPVSIRKGFMLTAHDDSKWLPGSNEFVVDLTVASITSDYGNVFGGPSFFLRRNFAAPGSTIVPYFQLGVGFVLNDAHQDETQQAIGQFFEFYLHAQVGLKIFLTPNLSLDIEGGLQHISNANLASRNLGVNAIGGQVGLTYYFPWQSE